MAYRFAFCMFIYCLVTLVALLIPWIRFELGPEVSLNGASPHLWAAV